MSDKLTQLKTMTEVVADTGDIEAIKQYRPQDATTNPSLVLKAFSLSQYEPLILRAIQQSQQCAVDAADQQRWTLDYLLIQQAPLKKPES